MLFYPRLLLWALGLPLVALLFSACETTPHVHGVMRPGSFSTVVIDAGHGGKDSGESPNQFLREKIVALDTARRVKALLDKEGVRTVMTRTDDFFVELDDRVAIANRYYPNAILVSIHYNASPSSSPRGIQTFFWRPDSYGLATRVQRHLVGETGLDNRGVTRRVLRLTHDPRVPAILCEGGFLTNRAEANLVSTEAFRQKEAEGIADGILEEQEQGDVDIGSLPPLEQPTYTRPSRRHYTGGHHRRYEAEIRKKRQHSKSPKAAKSAKKGKPAKSGKSKRRITRDPS